MSNVSRSCGLPSDSDLVELKLNVTLNSSLGSNASCRRPIVSSDPPSSCEPRVHVTVLAQRSALEREDTRSR